MQKVPCAICEVMILTGTADKTGGFCIPCYRKNLFEQKESFILKAQTSYDQKMDRDEIVSVFLFRQEQDLLSACNRLTKELSIWFELRRSTVDGQFSYWIVVRYKDVNIAAKAIKDFEDLSHPFYGRGVIDQSEFYK
ncbi:MAG: hypothetical protein V1747_10070 [Candidatus Omnitrophota bacterium]